MSDNGDEEPKPKTGDVDAFDLVPCMAMCCCIYSLYTEIPDCFGSVCENTFLCCNCKIITCKASKEKSTFCKFCSCDWDFVAANMCCMVSIADSCGGFLSPSSHGSSLTLPCIFPHPVQTRSQAFCLDIRAACPPTGDFPCLVTFCCITVRTPKSLYSSSQAFLFF